MSVVNVDGSGSVDLGPLDYPLVAPAWSPSGHQILFARNGAIWTVNADRTNPRQLTASASGTDAYPFWSPDGSRIAWSRKNAPDSGVWAMAADGSGQRLIDASAFEDVIGYFRSVPVAAAGYRLAARDGGVFDFGTACYQGSAAPSHPAQPIVGMATNPGRAGCWLAASDGGIFSFGAAAFYGSTGALTLNKPIVGMAATPTVRGYWPPPTAASSPIGCDAAVRRHGATNVHAAHCADRRRMMAPSRPLFHPAAVLDG